MRKRALEVNSPITVDRMLEREAIRVQELAIQPPPVGTAAVDRVPDNRKPGRFQMDTDLVGPAGLQTRLAQRDTGQLLKYADMGDRLTAGPLVDHRHAQAIPRMARDRSVDAERRRRGAVYEDEITTINSALAQQTLQASVNPL